ncbi:hypothetical protein KIW84_041905 [Lathyrus oleraceus]|uniref:Uncharacterized protein n=1 Tax=Pisum sativum TaxID=3888 RepID=A0A9D4XB13_PEA|nr:hypothetical protein KIW84_041905 [Pisum sativum]
MELILLKDPRLKYNLTSVVIKCQGWWTNTLYDLIQTELNKGANKRKGIPVAMEEPYGPASLDFLKHDSVHMVVRGNAITSFLSILAEIDSSINRKESPKKNSLLDCGFTSDSCFCRSFILQRIDSICVEMEKVEERDSADVAEGNKPL